MHNVISVRVVTDDFAGVIDAIHDSPRIGVRVGLVDESEGPIAPQKPMSVSATEGRLCKTDNLV